VTLGSTLAETLATFAACDTRQYGVDEDAEARRAVVDASGW